MERKWAMHRTCGCQRAAECAAEKESSCPSWREFRLYGPPDCALGTLAWDEQRVARVRHQEETRKRSCSEIWKQMRDFVAEPSSAERIFFDKKEPAMESC